MSTIYKTVMKDVRIRASGGVTLTKAGAKLMTLVGKCMDGGGSVDMTTYLKHESGSPTGAKAEFANVTMEWQSEPPLSRELSRLRSQKWKN